MANNEQALNELMQSLANQVRIVSGKTELMGIETMANTLNTENSALNSKLNVQSDLIAQIETALEGKVGGGGSAPTLQDKTVTPTTSTQIVTPDSGYDGLSKVTVNAIPSTYIQPSGTKTVTTNGTHDVKSYESVSVNVASTGEDVTAETNAYTEKITQLTTAVAALENELAGKANGDGAGGDNITSSSVTIVVHNPEPGVGEGYIYYTNSNDEYVCETISLSPFESSINIDMMCNTIFYTQAISMGSGCEISGGQILNWQYGILICVITEPTATIYLA